MGHKKHTQKAQEAETGPGGAGHKRHVSIPLPQTLNTYTTGDATIFYRHSTPTPTL